MCVRECLFGRGCGTKNNNVKGFCKGMCVRGWNSTCDVGWRDGCIEGCPEGFVGLDEGCRDGCLEGCWEIMNEKLA